MENKILNRTCLACKLEKPLNAFLQLSGTQGTTYGSICSTCRSETARKKALAPKEPEQDESDSGGSGLKINGKAKVRQETDQKIQRKKIKDSSHIADKAQEKLILDKAERKEIREKAEKDHRTDYIDAKKKQEKRAIGHGITAGKNIFTEHHEAIEAQSKETAEQHESRLNKIDTLHEFRDSQFGEIKFHSEIFRAFRNRSEIFQSVKSRLGFNGHFNVKNSTPTANAKDANKKPAKNNDPLVDYVDKKWVNDPTKRGGRGR